MKTITYDTYIKALALWYSAVIFAHKAEQFENLMHELLEEERGGLLSDSIYGVSEPLSHDFDKHLKAMGIEVEVEGK